MAIVKPNYVKRGVEAKSRAKATIRYIQSRPGQQKEKLTREIFGSDGPLTGEQTYRMIDEAARGTLFYRLVIAPDPRKEDSRRDLDLPELTKQTIIELENRLRTQVLFAAVEHNDHTSHRHVHVLALINQKLSRADIDFLRTSATEATLLQRRIRGLANEQKLSPKLQLTKTAPGRGVRTRPERGLSAAPPRRIKPVCPSCTEGTSQPMRKISKNLHKCSSCGIVVRATALGMETEQSAGWGRGLEFGSGV